MLRNKWSASSPDAAPGGHQYWPPRRVSLDHFVRDCEKRRRHLDAKEPGGVQIDDEFKPCRLHYRKVGRFRALEDVPGIDAALTPCIRNAGSVAHQPTALDRFAIGKGRRDAVARRLAPPPPAMPPSPGAVLAGATIAVWFSSASYACRIDHLPGPQSDGGIHPGAVPFPRPKDLLRARGGSRLLLERVRSLKA